MTATRLSSLVMFWTACLFVASCSNGAPSTRTEQRVVVLDWRDFNATLKEISYIDPGELEKLKKTYPDLAAYSTEADWIDLYEISERNKAERLLALKQYIARIDAHPEMKSSLDEQIRLAREMGLFLMSYQSAKEELADAVARKADDVATVLRRQQRRKLARDFTERKTTPSQEHEKAVNALLVDGWKVLSSAIEETLLPVSETFDVKYSVTITLQREVKEE